MRMSLIAALSRNHVIGQNNALPWHLPDDLKHFKALTLGKPVIMGRKTFESIGKPLPKRRNIILTRNPHYSAKGCEVVHDLPTALKLTEDEREVMIIGGEKIFTLALPLANTLFLTLIHQEIEGDAYFPEWDPAQWVESEREEHPADAEHTVAFSFVRLDKKPVVTQ